MKKKQTAVEWFQEQIIDIVNGRCELSEIEIFNKAKAMEKEQIMDAALELNPGNIPPKLVKELAEQYYNETFKQEEQ
jgi:hypothetical protein